MIFGVLNDFSMMLRESDTERKSSKICVFSKKDTFADRDPSLQMIVSLSSVDFISERQDQFLRHIVHDLV